MNLKDVAKLIPPTYRAQILEANAIFKAIAIPGDPHMHMLFILWTTYVNGGSEMDMTCTKCLGEILSNFKRLQPLLIDLHREDQLL